MFYFYDIFFIFNCICNIIKMALDIMGFLFRKSYINIAEDVSAMQKYLITTIKTSRVFSQ